MSWNKMTEILEKGIELEVSQSIIDRSEPLCITNCPISLSFKEALKGYGNDICVATTSERVTIYEDLTRRANTFVFRPSEDISRWILIYDDYVTDHLISPFTMSINLIPEHEREENIIGRFGEINYDGLIVVKQPSL